MNSVITAVTRSGVEGFINPEDAKQKNEAYADLIVVLITFVIALLILSLVGKLLWNGVIVDLFTCVRPAKSVLQILGLFVFVSLLV
jgi:hypothetical protein